MLLLYLSSSFPRRYRKLKHTAEKGKKDMLPFKKGAISKTTNRFFLVSTFEWRKYKREGVVKRFVIIILLLTIGGYAFIAFSTNQLREQYISNTHGIISFYNEIVLDHRTSH